MAAEASNYEKASKKYFLLFIQALKLWDCSLFEFCCLFSLLININSAVGGDKRLVENYSALNKIYNWDAEYENADHLKAKLW